MEEGKKRMIKLQTRRKGKIKRIKKEGNKWSVILKDTNQRGGKKWKKGERKTKGT